jgi:hypothetical protein
MSRRKGVNEDPINNYWMESQKPKNINKRSRERER